MIPELQDGFWCGRFVYFDERFAGPNNWRIRENPPVMGTHRTFLMRSERCSIRS